MVGHPVTTSWKEDIKIITGTNVAQNMGSDLILNRYALNSTDTVTVLYCTKHSSRSNMRENR